jgi:transcriptional regulator with XRE-family HTH domain
MPTTRGFFAERLRELRRARGQSQPALAERSGVAVSTIRQFEGGRREPTYGTLVKLAAGLGVSLAAFDQTAPGPAQDTPPANLIRGPVPERTELPVQGQDRLADRLRQH